MLNAGEHVGADFGRNVKFRSRAELGWKKKKACKKTHHRFEPKSLKMIQKHIKNRPKAAQGILFELPGELLGSPWGALGALGVLRALMEEPLRCPWRFPGDPERLQCASRVGETRILDKIVRLVQARGTLAAQGCYLGSLREPLKW